MSPALICLVVGWTMTLVVGWFWIRGLRRRTEALSEENRELRDRLDRPLSSLPVKAASFALRTAVGTAVGTAVRVRRQGVGGFLTSSIEELTGIALADRGAIADVAAPDGTVTLFFSDIVDSTALNERLGDKGWVELLTAHDKIVRHQVARHSGHVVKSQGDGFMVAFGDPAEAVRAGLAMQGAFDAARGKALRRTPITVRMGLHLGRAVEKDGDYFGRNVAMAARVAAEAAGREILVSDEAYAVVADEFTFATPRECELKGFSGTHRLWPLAALD